MEWLIGLLTLAFLEVVLGVDNVIFISIVTSKLPTQQQPRARYLGILFALVFRVILVVSLVWLLEHLTKPLFTISGHGFGVREIVLFVGGLFLLAKSTSELHHKVEAKPDIEMPTAKAQKKAFMSVIVQITLLDIVFSFDSILTAIGLTHDVLVMIAAIVIALVIMVIFAGRISRFISRNPTLEVLALSFLILIGFMLVLESVHIEVPKGYIYFAVFFSLLVEFINLRMQKKQQPATEPANKEHKEEAH